MDEDAIRLQSKRFNETLKLLVTTFNSVALVVFAGSVVQPMLGLGASFTIAPSINWPWFLGSIILHASAHALTRLVRLE